MSDQHDPSESAAPATTAPTSPTVRRRPSPPRPSGSFRLLLWLAVFGLLALVGLGVGTALLVGSGGGSPLSAHEGWLQWKVAPGLSDAPTAGSPFDDPLDLPPLTTEVAAAIRAAGEDPDITGLFLQVIGVDLGWSQTQELRDAVVDFRASGKPCVAWSSALTNKEYYLASACGDIRLAPAGLTLVNGLEITQTYFKGTFEKFGVTANFEHVGDFKSAVEPFQRTGPSEAAQAATDALLDSLYGQLARGIAAGRGVDEAKARGWLDDPPITPEDALAAGMIDKLSYVDEVTTDTVKGDLVKMTDYLHDQRSSWGHGAAKVAVLYLEGTIVDGTSEESMFGGRSIGDRTVQKQLESLREDEDVKAIVLRVNSPGGSGSASDNMWRELQITREKKPVVVSMSDYAASGGYYISMGNNYIFAEPGTLTGSIGVFGGKMNLAGLYAYAGMTLHTSQRGAYAGLLSSTSDFSELEKVKFRRFLESFYTIFVTKAAEGRGMSFEEMHAVAQGRVWTGEQALERHLVDELGGLDQAVAKAAELGGLTAGGYGIQRVPERKGFLDQLLDELENPGGNAQSQALGAQVRLLPPELQQALGQVEMLDRVLAGNGVAAMLPGELQIR